MYIKKFLLVMLAVLCHFSMAQAKTFVCKMKNGDPYKVTWSTTTKKAFSDSYDVGAVQGRVFHINQDYRPGYDLTYNMMFHLNKATSFGASAMEVRVFSYIEPSSNLRVWRAIEIQYKDTNGVRRIVSGSNASAACASS